MRQYTYITRAIISTLFTKLVFASSVSSTKCQVVMCSRESFHKSVPSKFRQNEKYRFRPESETSGVVRSRSESSGVYVSQVDSGRLWTTPTDSVRLRMTSNDSRRLRLLGMPGDSGQLQTIPNDSQHYPSWADLSSKIVGVASYSTPDFCQLNPSLVPSAPLHFQYFFLLLLFCCYFDVSAFLAGLVIKRPSA